MAKRAKPRTNDVVETPTAEEAVGIKEQDAPKPGLVGKAHPKVTLLREVISELKADLPEDLVLRAGRRVAIVGLRKAIEILEG